MKPQIPHKIGSLLLAALLITPPQANLLALSAADPLAYADPSNGVDAGGNVVIGACLPFSMVRLSPDNHLSGNAGYETGKPVLGFSHNHVSGTGGSPRFGHIRITPQIGALDTAFSSSPINEETTEPGYYSAILATSGIRAELTLSERCGVHRYTFPASDKSRLLIDVGATLQRPNEGRRGKNIQARKVSDRRMEGQATFQGGWGNHAVYTVFFVAEFDKPFASSGTWNEEKEGASSLRGIYAEFATHDKEQIGVRVGISYKDIATAGKNLAQTEGKSFDQIRAEARKAWGNYLERIQVQGGSEEQRKIFYSNLYHSALMPTELTGENPRWQSDEPHYWDFYAIWDTFHCVNSLYALIAPERAVGIVRCLLDIYKHTGWLPDAWIAGEHASAQGGSNADIVIADAVVKNLKGFDLHLAYEAVKKNATVPSDRPELWGRAGDYFTKGYLPCISVDGNNDPACPSSRTLEYAMNDFAVAQVAKAAGKPEDARLFIQRSITNAFSLWNPETKFFWAKDKEGKWLDGFKPTLHTASWKGPFYEGNPWQYAFYTLHDVQGLIQRHGGAEPFVAFLDQLFDGKFYNPGNEPDIFAPWLYHYAGRPDKSSERILSLLRQHYHANRRGLPGNDDAGTLSTWFVFASMGFFPNAGQDVYLIHTPLFSKSTLQLQGGKTFTIETKGLSEKSKYIQSATLNGKPWTKSWFCHGDIVNGATLILEMGEAPSSWGTKELPPSASTSL